MPDEVKGPPRAYDSTRRRARAAETRASVLTAARALFLDHGYVSTTVPAVAADAGVSVETVYKAFGNKAGLVKAVFDVALAGDDEPVPILQRAFVSQNMAEPDPRRKLIDYGELLVTIAPRANPILMVLREAAVVDSGAAEVWRTVQAERLQGMAAFASHLHHQGHLGEGISADHARDVLWTLNSVEVWDLLVRQRRWTDHRYGTWIGEQLIAALLD